MIRFGASCCHCLQGFFALTYYNFIRISASVLLTERLWRPNERSASGSRHKLLLAAYSAGAGMYRAVVCNLGYAKSSYGVRTIGKKIIS
jgi:hypothetical protein